MVTHQLPELSNANDLSLRPELPEEQPCAAAAHSSSKSRHLRARHKRSLAWRFRLLSVGWLVGCLLLAGFCVSKAFDSQPTTRTRQVPVQKWERRQTPMDQVRKGDMVLARDEYGTQVSAKPVTRLFLSTSDHLRILTFRTPDGAEQVIKTTDEHPIWIEQQDDYVDAKLLKVGDEVVTPGGEIQTLVSTRYEPHPEGVPVFNFEVEDTHTYYVAENLNDAAPILVHNACHMHHSIPNEIRKRLPTRVRNHRDIIGRPGLPNRMAVDAKKHLREVHSKSGISSKMTGIYGGKYNLRFDEEIRRRGGYRRMTVRTILEIRDVLVREFGI